MSHDVSGVYCAIERRNHPFFIFLFFYPPLFIHSNTPRSKDGKLWAWPGKGYQTVVGAKGCLW